MEYLYFLVTLFSGFALGRSGHIYFGHLKSPHHWIWGMIGMILGFIFLSFPWGIFLVIFGLGIFISDLKDFIYLKFYGTDDDKDRTFWNID